MDILNELLNWRNVKQQQAMVAAGTTEGLKLLAESKRYGAAFDEIQALRQQLAAALAACETKDVALSAIIGATKSHVDGRDLLAELHPRHYMDIKVRRNGKDIWFEADWLSNLQRAITSHKAAIAIRPDASAIKSHDAELIERCAITCEEYGRSLHGEGRDDSEAFDCADAIRKLKASS